MGDHGRTLKIEYDEIGMKTKLILTQFELTYFTLSSDEKTFFNTLLGFIPGWDFKPTNAIDAGCPGVDTSEKIRKLSTKDKIHRKCDVIDGIWDLIFDEKSFFNALLGFTPYWDDKPTNAIHADSPGVYTSEKNCKLKYIRKNSFKR